MKMKDLHAKMGKEFKNEIGQTWPYLKAKNIFWSLGIGQKKKKQIRDKRREGEEEEEEEEEEEKIRRNKEEGRRQEIKV